MKIPAISGREMCRILFRKGWEVSSRKGSHVGMKNPATGKKSPYLSTIR
jgi:predicted RNA binding protein YcfA (HicA-like mRNA interferase family)